MPQNLKSVCNSYTDVFEYEPIWTYESVEDSKMWVIPPLGKNRIRLDDAEHQINLQILEN